ncbi:MAG: sulfotransferase [Synechococcus sp. s2_metabat2_7]|nr:sulfotransferase [Synechococcus sp. s2_metabat2_7]
MTESKRRLLLIRGLGHSGTTILDLALGAHPQITGLGEAVRLLEKPAVKDSHRGPAQLRGALRFKRECTCGLVADRCPVWGPVLRWLPTHDDAPLPVKLKRLLDGVGDGPAPSGRASWVVESYQDDFGLPFLDDPSLEIRVIHLTRDVRSWVHSRSRDGRQRGRWLPGLLPLVRWWRLCARHERQLRRCGKPVFRLGYEELALRPEQSLRRLCDWLELDFEPAMLSPVAHSASHILAGNRVRFDAKRSAAIRYDAQWMAAPSGVAQAALVVPWVAALNRRLVYSADAESR